MTVESKTPLIREDGLRLDGRSLDELRQPLWMKVGILGRADGSAFIRHGRNKIIAAVYGPRQLHPRHMEIPDRARIRCEYRLSTFSVGERKSPAPRRREHELSKIIQEALEPTLFLEHFPRATVDVFINVLDADGGTRCASVTAASLGLADAGIPMRGLVSAVAAGKVEDKIVLDLSDIEDKDGQGDLPIALAMGSGDITLLQLDGQFTVEEVEEAIKLAEKGCEKIFELQREALIQKYSQVATSAAPSEEEE